MSARASLQVFPVSVTLNEKVKTSQLNVSHSFTKETWVNVEPVFFKMDVNGSLNEVKKEELAKDSEWSALRMVRFSPKRFLLKPGESQVLRMRTFISAKSKDGMYRIHLKFIPDEPGQKVLQKSTGTGTSYQLNARIAVAVPVYVKKGNKAPVAQVKGLKVLKEKNKSFFNAVLEQNSGTIRGNLIAYVKKSEKKIIVATVNGVASYIPKRILNFELNEEFSNLGTSEGLDLVLEFQDAKTSQVLAQDSVKL